MAVSASQTVYIFREHNTPIQPAAKFAGFSIKPKRKIRIIKDNSGGCWNQSRARYLKTKVWNKRGSIPHLPQSPLGGRTKNPSGRGG